MEQVDNNTQGATAQQTGGKGNDNKQNAGNVNPHNIDLSGNVAENIAGKSGIDEMFPDVENFNSSHVASILEMAQQDPEFAKNDDVQKLISMANEMQEGGSNGQQQQGSQQSGQVSQGNAAGQQQAQTGGTYGNTPNTGGDGGVQGDNKGGHQQAVQNQGGQQQASGKPEGSSSTQDNSPFFASDGKRQEDINVEEVPNIIREKYSIDGDDDKEVVRKFISSADKWRNDSQKFHDIDKKFKGVQDGINNLPTEIKTAISKFENGEDWKSPLTAPSLDFDKPFKSQDSKQVLERYFPNEFSPEDLEDMNDPQIKRALSAAEKSFNAEKTQYQIEKDRSQTQAQEMKRALEQTAEGSVSHLKGEFPEFDDNLVDNVKNVLLENKIVSLFYDEDGTFKKDAAEKVALAMYGKDQIGTMRNRLKELNRSEGNRERASQENNSPRQSSDVGNTGSGQSQVQQGQDEAAKVLDTLGDFFEQSTY